MRRAEGGSEKRVPHDLGGRWLEVSCALGGVIIRLTLGKFSGNRIGQWMARIREKGGRRG